MTVDDASGPAGRESESDRAPQSLLPAVREALQSHPARSEAEMVTDYRALRAAIGLIAFFIVPVVYIGNWLLFTRHVGSCFLPSMRIPASLSGFYYTHMRNLFVGAMCAMGIFLAAYRGYDRWDSRLTNVAGVAAICIGLCPTMPPSYLPSPSGPNQFFAAANVCGPATPITYPQSGHQQLFGIVHLGSLVVLFVMVFLMVLVQFTRTSAADGGERGDPAGGLRDWWNTLFSLGIAVWWRSLFAAGPANSRKGRRNRIYVTCAGCIAMCGLLAVISAIWPSIGTVAPWLLFAESGAFLAFGVAWFVKGAASAQPDRPQLGLWMLSRTARRWLADDVSGEAVGASAQVTAGWV